MDDTVSSARRHLSITVRNFQIQLVGERNSVRGNSLKESSRHNSGESNRIDAKKRSEEAIRFAKRREILFTRNAAGNVRRRWKGGGESNLAPIIESLSVLPRELAHGIVSISGLLARGTTATLRQFVIPRSCARRCV